MDNSRSVSSKTVSSPLESTSGLQTLSNRSDKPRKQVTFQLPVGDPTFSGIEWKDVVVISALWSFEALYNTFETWKRHSLDEATDVSIWQSKETSKILAESVDMLVLTCLGMMSVGALASFFRTNNFCLLLFSLGIFTVGPIFFALSLASESHTLGNAAVLTEIGWHLGNPLRYWLIFHQKFPLRISTSHQLTTFNECLVLIGNYISSVCIRKYHGNSFVRLQLDLGFIEFFIICWLIFISAVIPLKNKVANNLDAIRRVYDRSEVFECFERRENNLRSLIFQGLLLSFIMFSLTKETIQLGMKESNQLLHQDVSTYRPDLVCAFLSMTCIEVILILFDKFDKLFDETFDLIIIGFAHLIITAVLGMVYALIESNRGKHSDFVVSYKSTHDKIVLIALMCLFGVAHGATLVSSNHFIWIQVPFQFRALLLASYLSANHLVGWTYRTYMKKFDFVQGIIVLSFQIFVTFCHCWLSFIFAKRLRRGLSDSEKRMKLRRV